MDTITIVTKDGSTANAPVMRLKIHPYDKESYMMIGGDTTGAKLDLSESGFMAERLGRLSELKRSLYHELYEAMCMLGWPRRTYRDPDVFLVVANPERFEINPN